MDKIQMLMHRFEAADSGERCEIIEQLNEFEDPRDASLFMDALADTSEDDVVRVEVLKGLAHRAYEHDIRAKFAALICNLLRDQSDDVLVRQYAGMAAGNFITCDGVLPLVEAIVRDPSDDEDVRYNAMDAIQSNVSLPDCRDALTRLVTVPKLGIGAERTLRENPEP